LVPCGDGLSFKQKPWARITAPSETKKPAGPEAGR
jgi:hypothetical protein